MVPAPAARKKDLIVAVLLAALFSLVGAGLLLGAAYLYQRRQDFLRRARQAQGEIVDFRRMSGGSSTSSRRREHRVPVVRFRTARGETVQFTSDTYSAMNNYRLGQKVTVYYDPARPGEARIAGWAELWFAPFILALVGLGALVIPPFTIWRAVKAGEV